MLKYDAVEAKSPDQSAENLSGSANGHPADANGEAGHEVNIEVQVPWSDGKLIPGRADRFYDPSKDHPFGEYRVTGEEVLPVVER